MIYIEQDLKKGFYQDAEQLKRFEKRTIQIYHRQSNIRCIDCIADYIDDIFSEFCDEMDEELEPDGKNWIFSKKEVWKRYFVLYPTFSILFLVDILANIPPSNATNSTDATNTSDNETKIPQTPLNDSKNSTNPTNPTNSTTPIWWFYTMTYFIYFILLASVFVQMHFVRSTERPLNMNMNNKI